MKAILSLTVLTATVFAAGAAYAGLTPPQITPVPEPTTLAVIAGGVGALAAAKFRNRK